MPLPRRALILGLAAVLAGCGRPGGVTRAAPQRNTFHAGDTAQMRALIDKYARLYDVPAPLIHRIVQRESGYNPGARNGPYYGLMQIHPQTAQTMGHRGPASDLLDADTNLRYAVRYLRGAWLLSRGSYDKAVSWYANGYYYEAKRRGLLVETGLKAG